MQSPVNWHPIHILTEVGELNLEKTQIGGGGVKKKPNKLPFNSAAQMKRLINENKITTATTNK